ncbi:MAG: hypothetical protein KAH31_08515 [Candidatus Sabulitectum sp.]|nr:hypothetical protein [Candidatus Sabulitectum sp.]
MGLFMVTVLTLIIPVSVQDQEYILEPVGIEFRYLPAEICPLVQGVMTEESGALAGQPNMLGLSFGCYYWEMENQIDNKDLWIEEKLSSVLPPNLMESINTTTPTWTEGSADTEIRGSLSLGLMSEISFTFSPPGGAMGRGRAYGIFRNGYAVLVIMYGPSGVNPQNFLQQIVARAVLSGE